MKKCNVCGQTHSPETLAKAAIIMHGKTSIETEWGRKTVCGIASIIGDHLITVHVRGGVAFCDSPQVKIIDHDHR